MPPPNIARFDIVSVRYEASELPSVVVSPDEMNAHLPTLIVAPIDEDLSLPYPTRIGGQIALEQLRTIPKTAVTQKMGRIKDATARAYVGDDGSSQAVALILRQLH